MFRKARIKLTIWYSLIIMLVSISFSLAMYRVLTAEFDRVERIERLRIQRGYPGQVMIVTPPGTNPRAFFIDPEVIEETKHRIQIILFSINVGIFGVSTIGGYFLAGQTLKPINDMVDEQNRFITDASHELRTPLTSMKAEIEVSLRDKKLSLNDAKTLLHSNLEEVDNLQALSDGLIKLTRYQSIKNSLTFVDVSTKNIIGDSIKRTTAMAKAKKIQLIDDSKDYNIQGNKNTLIELFTILIDNAIKYSHQHTTITINTRQLDGWIYLSVNDQGMGIKNEDIPHLFERFYRADKSRTKTNIPGYGLGLSIAKQIVKQHHGDIEVKSEYQKGSTFTVKLPLKQAKKLMHF